MTEATVNSGICGFTTRVEARMVGDLCVVSLESGCHAVQRLAEQLREVDPMREISFRGDPPRTLELAAKTCAHAACPVPVAILKAVEAEAGLALPADVTIHLSQPGR